MKHLLVAAAAATFALGSASATVFGGTASIGAGGDVEVLTLPLTGTPGNTVGEDNFQDDDTFFAFDEAQDVMLTSSLTVNLDTTTTATVDAGTMVDSHYVFFDPLGFVTGTAEINFSGNILGVIVSGTALAATDATLGLAGVTYANPDFRSLEDGDTFSISGNTLTISLLGFSPGDYVRVLTEAAPVPLPGAALFFLTAMGGGLFARARKSAA